MNITLRNTARIFLYEDFLPMWKAENWQPQKWAELFRKSGAKYVVLTTKHHDGFCLYPSEYTDFNCEELGPKRDITGELTDAVRSEGLKNGTLLFRADRLAVCQ